jgi:peptidoglycan/xylan/chitin deacetylase (PgdA/CDA1 family)
MPETVRSRLRLLAAVLILALMPKAGLGADQVTAFVYHRFGDSRYPSTNTTLAEFRSHLETLRTGGYQVLPLGDIVKRLRKGTPLPDRCVAITVDDAFRSFLRGAMPLLREYGYPATLFVNTGEVGGAEYLDWEELRQLAREGIEIGNHSAAHDYLLDRRRGESQAGWRQRVTGEIRTAQDELTARLGSVPRLFAYPYGEFSLELIQIVSELGFEAAFGQQSGVISRDQGLFDLPRFPVAGNYASQREFRERLNCRPLPLQVLAPEDTVVRQDNPPQLRIKIDPRQIDSRTLRCFVPGQPPAMISADTGSDGVYEIRARAPLNGRRSKYTLTAKDRQGNWCWFSQLWVRPES